MDRIEKLKSFIASDPNDYFSRHALAMEYIKAGDDPEAISILEKILAENPDYIGSYYHLGKLFEKQNDPEKALNIYNRGIVIATKLNEKHARGELLAAIDLMD